MLLQCPQDIWPSNALLSSAVTHQIEPCANAARPATSASAQFLPAASALIGDASKALLLAGSHNCSLVEHYLRNLKLGMLLRLALRQKGICLPWSRRAIGATHLNRDANKALPLACRLQSRLLGLTLRAQRHNGPSAAGELCSSCKQQQRAIAALQWCSGLHLVFKAPSWCMSAPQHNAAYDHANEAS